MRVTSLLLTSWLAGRPAGWLAQSSLRLEIVTLKAKQMCIYFYLLKARLNTERIFSLLWGLFN